MSDIKEVKEDHTQKTSLQSDLSRAIENLATKAGVKI